MFMAQAEEMEELPLDEQFRFCYYLVKLVKMKIRRERKHFANMRRFALNNNKKDDYLWVVREQCQALDRTFNNILFESFPDDFDIIYKMVNNVYKHPDYIFKMTSTIIKEEGSSFITLKGVSSEKLQQI